MLAENFSIGDQGKASRFSPILGILKNRQYYSKGIRMKSSLPFGKSASCPWKADK